MGVMCHHAIVVTCGYGNHAQQAHDKAVEIFGQTGVSNLSAELVNGNQSFCVWPDGSKEGWSESADGDARRESFVSWLDRQRYEDGSTPLKWVEVAFGEGCEGGSGDTGAEVVRHYAEVDLGEDYTGPADLSARKSR